MFNKFFRKRHRGVPNWVWTILVVMGIFIVIYGICVITAPKTETNVMQTPPVQSPQPIMQPPPIIQSPPIISPICGNQVCEEGELISCPTDCGEPR